MELKQYMNILYKRLWLLVLLPVLAAAVSAYISFYMLKPVYEADTTLYVIKKIEAQTALGEEELLAGQLLVNDYSELIRSRTVTSAVINELGLGKISNKKLADLITVSAKNDTRIIEIRVQNEDPKAAMDIANKIGEIFITKAVELMKVETVEVFDKAIIPELPVKPNPYLNIAIAVFAGIMSAAGVIFLVEYMDNTIKTTEDVEKYMDLPVLGIIPEFSIK